MFGNKQKIGSAKKHLGRTTALVGAVAAAAAAVSGTAMAQDNDEIVVTGTRIRGVTDANSPSPVSVATAEEISLTRAVSLEDVLGRMVGPDFTGGANVNSNNGAVGVSAIGLRNLGPARTLVLVDGQRLVPIFFGASSIPDLNAVPASLVERIEVLRDGASSVYGADAVGGVINIITKRDFEGLHLEGSSGLSSQGDAPSYSAQALIGMNMDRGNVTFALSMDRQDALHGQDRDWAGNVNVGQPSQGGSAYRSQVNVLQDEINSDNIWINGVLGSRSDPDFTAGVDCLDYLEGQGVAKLNSNCSLGWNDLAGSLEREQISGNAHYDITDNVTFIAQGFFTHRESGQSLRPEPLLGDSISSTINVPGVGATTIYPGLFVPISWPGFNGTNNNPDDGDGGSTLQPCADPAGCVLAFLTPNQFGPRTYRQTSDTYRMRFGLEGEFDGDVHWEAGFVTQHNDTVQEIHNSGRWDHLAQITGQMNCVDVPGGCTDAPVGWGGGVTSIPVAAPDFTAGPNMFTPEQVAYLTYTSETVNRSIQDYFYANVDGPAFELPGGTARWAVGMEHREESITNNPDPLVVGGYAPGTQNPTGGGITVDSLYGELNLPVFTGFTLTPSVRRDDYDLFGSSETYKVGVDWEIIQDIRFRGAYNTGFRAPSLAELFGGSAVSYISAQGDPCDERAPADAADNANSGQGLRTAGSTCAVAINGGAAYTTFNPSQNSITGNQIPLLIGGNPNLLPEESTGWNAGLVITPRFLPGFTFSVDHYEVEIDNSILTGGIAGAINPDIVLLGCYGPDQNLDYCSLIHRNSANNIVQVDSPNANVGTATVAGEDYTVSWSSDGVVDMPGGSTLNISVQAQHQAENTQSNPDGTITEYTGTYLVSNESVQPEWRGMVNADVLVGNWTFHWDSRYVQGTEGLQDGGSVDDYWVHGAAIAYDFGEIGPVSSGRWTLGVNNLFDEDPPFVAASSICKCNSLAGPYDFYGQYFFTRLSTEF